MTNTGKIVPLETVEPEMARKLLPGVHFMVSSVTFAEAAAEVDEAREARRNELAAREAQAAN